MADPYAPTDDWREGYDAGYEAGKYSATQSYEQEFLNEGFGKRALSRRYKETKAKRKMPQKGKAKILTTMTKPIWDKYKKGNGKKTYVTIRAQVSRSQAYKKKVKGMK